MTNDPTVSNSPTDNAAPMRAEDDGLSFPRG
jgi:hypothetical protein